MGTSRLQSLFGGVSPSLSLDLIFKTADAKYLVPNRQFLLLTWHLLLLLNGLQRHYRPLIWRMLDASSALPAESTGNLLFASQFGVFGSKPFGNAVAQSQMTTITTHVIRSHFHHEGIESNFKQSYKHQSFPKDISDQDSSHHFHDSDLGKPFFGSTLQLSGGLEGTVLDLLLSHIAGIEAFKAAFSRRVLILRFGSEDLGSLFLSRVLSHNPAVKTLGI